MPRDVVPVTAFVTVGSSNVRHPSDIHTSSIRPGQEADPKLKMADSRWAR